ncbi:MAG TPA: gephyrin-like molybdotransferase Glp [Gemmataceae bacterium]|nr:gephyrin-like molybdotransferase Glp [Gemmataceae bacterium]
MLTIEAAQTVVLDHVSALPPATAALADAPGLVLAEDVVSDLDMPPYDKAMMDGYAVRLADLPGGRGTLTVIEEITAGKTPSRALGPGQAARIMTGAPIPYGTDAVVQVERTHSGVDGQVQVNDPGVKAGQHLLTRGREMRLGDVVVRRGTVLRPQEIGVLATVGRPSVQVIPRPKVAVLPTGDELVEPHQKPGPGQIRNGNGPALVAQIVRGGGVPRYLGIAPDQLDSLKAMIASGLQSDVLLLSGGVSAGKLDLVPDVLRELGVQAHFHKVAMKPGKPLLFGTRDKTLVFGLPGNPVSTFLCFELFVRPALRLLRGMKDPGINLPTATLTEDYTYHTDRPTYHPAKLETTPEGWRARVVPWFGSPDLRGLTNCDCFVVFPAGDHCHRAGQMFPVLRMESSD